MGVVDTSLSPYFDDYQRNKEFYRILFRPGRPVQARELTQLQTIITNQFKNLGDHLFNEGAMVIPGQITYDRTFDFVKLEDTQPNGSAVVLDNFLPDAEGNHRIIQGSISGIRAQVILAIAAEGADPITLFVKYINSGNDTETDKTFADTDQLFEVIDDVVQTNAIGQVISGTSQNPATGSGSSASIQEGVYYIRGTYAIVQPQTIILEKYSDAPSFKVGLEIQESIITSEDDSSLLDNAQGSPNFAAPGADRLKITLVLQKKELDSVEDEDFIELLRLENGIKRKLVEVTDYSIVEQTLARRTFDESGDYAIRPFNLDLREHLDDGTNRGVFSAAEGGDSTKLAAGLEPGKAFVRGFEIKTIATEFIDVDKARDFITSNNSITRANLGNYILVNNVFNVPEVDEWVEVELHDVLTTRGNDPASQIGTAKIRAIEYQSGTLGSESEIYRVYIFDVSLNAGKTLSDVHALYISGSPAFTADVLSELTIIDLVGTGFVVGQTYTDSTDTFSEVAVSWNPTTGKLITKKDGANSIIPINSTIDNAAQGVDSAFVQLRTKLFNIQNNILIFQLPQDVVKTIKPLGVSDTTYETRRVFEGTVTGNEITFAAQANEIFSPFSNVDYLLAYTSTGGTATAGDIVALTSGDIAFGGSPTGSNITISNLENVNVKLIATITKGVSGAGKVERTKTLVEDAQVAITSANFSTTDPMSLGKADGYQLKAVHDGTTTDDPDIKSRFIFDNGQRDNFYGLATIQLLPGQKPPDGDILVVFDHFTHSSGDYFSVDSYLASVNYEEIPSYTSKKTGRVFNLTDCFDFRPVINDAGTTFTGQGELFKINSDVRADFDFYLGRIDKIYLAQDGEFRVAKGTSSLEPKPPEDPKDGMVLYTLRLGAFTFGKDDVLVRRQDNRRYTMRDIGKLERRIENLEYYTSLNLLEKETEALNIRDAVTGLDRFKNGFVVDNFTGHNIGDVFNTDYRCSMDFARGELRPIFVENNTPFQFDEAFSLFFEYRTKKPENDLLTLPYTDEVWVQQPFASQVINVNPYAIYNWAGSITLDPPSDEWKSTDRRPDVVITDNTAFESLTFLNDPRRTQGTIWNEWVTDWVGEPISDIETERIVSPPHSVPQPFDGKGANNPNVTVGGWFRAGTRRQTVTTKEIETTTTRQRQSRTGIRTVVVPRVVKETVNDRVLNVAFIPFIRSREVKFIGKRLKPNTKFFPYFDKVAVSEHVRPLPGFGEAGGTNFNDALISDGVGRVEGVFRIPNTDDLRFRTGTRNFRLTDDRDNAKTATSFADASYTASGVLETRQRTIQSVREPSFETQVVTENRIIANTERRVVAERVRWQDPLAQTFIVDGQVFNGGVFLTKVDLFFNTKDANIPVTVQIREVENGLPTQRVLPFAEAVVNGVDVNTSSDATVSTEFAFPAPVFLRPDQEYCFVIMSNSNNYNVFISEIGQTQINSDRIISEQPYAGVMFKSQNASTWTPDQAKDIKFTLYRAKFDTSVSGTLFFTNQDNPVKTLGSLPLITKNGSNIVRVIHEDHGMPEGSKITITFPAGTPVGDTDNLNGILTKNIVNDTTLQAEYTISNVELDSYTIQIEDDLLQPDNADATGRVGPDGITVTENYQADALHPILSQFVPAGTQLDWGMKNITGKTAHSNQVAYTKDTAFSNIVVNQNILFDHPVMVASKLNETNFVSGSTDFARKSLTLQATMTSTVDNLSPIIDTKRMSAILVHNRITVPGPQANNVQVLDEVEQSAGQLTFSASASTITSDTADDFKKFVVGKYITISGTSSNNKDFNNAVLIKEISTDKKVLTVEATLVDEGPVGGTITQLENFIDEYAPVGATGPSRYMVRKVNLTEAANSLAVFLTVLRPSEGDVKVYRRTIPVDSDITLEEQPWIEMSLASDTDTSPAENSLDFREYKFEADSIGEFNSFSIKVVLLSSNSSKPVVVSDLRTIALGT